MVVGISAFHTYTLIYLFQFVKDYEKEYLQVGVGLAWGLTLLREW